MSGTKKCGGGGDFYVKLGILAVLGTLTHYYYLIYLFWCCVIWGIRIIFNRRWKELGTFVATMGLSGVASVAIFPYMLRHIFIGYRGKESFDRLLHSSWFDNIKAFWNGVDELWGGMSIAFVIVAAGLVVFLFFYEQLSLKECGKRLGCWCIVLLPALLYFLTVSKIAMVQVVQSLRYISPIYGVAVILLIGLLIGITQFICNDRLAVILGICFVGILLNNSWKSYTWPEQYKEAADAVKTAKQYGINNECIYVFNRVWRSMPSYQEFIQYQEMTFIPESNLELLNQSEYTEYDSVVVYFDKNVGDEQIEAILNDIIMRNPGLTGYDELYEYSYNVAYFLM